MYIYISKSYVTKAITYIYRPSHPTTVRVIVHTWQNYTIWVAKAMIKVTTTITTKSG